ncbi:hypothetical protein CFIO01_02257 [Colletotrichum fioriniae PJ7]|uniref:Carbohydrate kinase PfkB domain-containing protein n=1 Tax=Colletotrichum fioriniae PJ7 TaxID=1445577 RepID=A0A010SMQ2_9PEZI|nr:hypothetical protein CFIO01_02257 [Colletotrichum fioriniae PJ7]
MEPETKTIAVIGALAVDHIMFVPRLPKAGGSIIATHAEKALGGKSANTALSTYRSCHNMASLPKGDGAFRVKMIGSAGNDHYGEARTQKLLENGIDVSDVKGVPRLPSAGTALHISSRLWIPPEQDREEVQRKRSWGVQPQCEGVLLPASDLGIASEEASCHVPFFFLSIC